MPDAAPPKIEFWYEFASTYSYPAAMRAEEVAKANGVRILWRPFLLGPVFAGLGWNTSPFNLQPAKGAYMWRDMERVCASLGLAFQRPDPFPQNGLLAARCAIALPDDGARSAFSKAVYLAEFAQGRPIADADVLSDILAGLGHDPVHMGRKAASDDVKSALRQATDDAQAHGIFGAPTWRTTDGEIFWGNDRLVDAVRWALR